MRSRIIFLLCISFLPSCGVVYHLDEALVLQDYTSEKDQMQKMVEEKDKKVDKLIKKIQSGELAAYQTKKDLVREFDEPVLAESFEESGIKKEKWLYRHQTRYLEGPKIYITFDDQGRIEKWNKIEAPKPQEKQDLEEKR